MRVRRRLLSAALVALFAHTAAAADALRIGMVPDAGATQVSVSEKAPLQRYLAEKIGTPVSLIIPTNYNATVEALGNGSLDVAYLGGLTYVKRSEEHTSELQSLMRISYAVFCLKKKKQNKDSEK